jgi:hypothetical protein
MTYVLVQGGWHGVWCWERVLARLTQGVPAHARTLAGLA